jgi:hypothetical protein
MQLIGYHFDHKTRTIFTSTGEKCSEPPYIDFLLKEHDAIRVCYHLDYFVSNLFSLIKLDHKQLIQIHDTTELSTHGYKFKYVPKKFLSIIKGDQFVLLSDASQYMDRWDLIDKPIDKAIEARNIGISVYNMLIKLGMHPKSVISPIATFEKEFLIKMDLPTIDDMPLEAAQYAYECCTGPIVQSYQKGHFDKCWDYDIKSAYGSILSECIDFRYGDWKKIDYFDPKSHYGYYDSYVNMTADFHPIVYAGANEKSHTPVGEWNRRSLKEELLFISQYNLGTWEVNDGWVFYPTKIVKPYFKIIKWLNEWKDRTKGLDRLVVKRILEALWGYTLRVDWNGDTAIPSEYMNTVFGAQTETLVKLKVAKFVIENNLQSQLLSIAVDGVLTTKEVNIENINSQQQGSSLHRT